MRKIFAALVLCAAATPALAAERVALLIGNSNYRNITDLDRGGRALRPAEELKRNGFTVVSLRNATAATLREALEGYLGQAEDARRVVIFLGGHFATTGETGWYLPVDADAALDAPGLLQRALPLSLVLDLAAEVTGGAVVALGREPEAERKALVEADSPVRPGWGRIDAPQGVTLVTGDISDVSTFLEDELLAPGVLIRDVSEVPDAKVRLEGYLPERAFLALRPGEAARPPESRPATPPPVPDRPSEEELFWEATTSIDTERAYGAYLERYPRGPHAAEARRRLDDLRDAPQRAAQEAEAALNLNRAARRAVQNHLTILGYDPRGIDGIFGRGSRAAISAWQKDNGFTATGFLNRNQLIRLREQGNIRAAELEEEGRRKAEQLRREDRAFWAETGSDGTEEGLREYLRRYPDGLFADEAEARLAQFEEERRQNAAAEERRVWDDARSRDTVDAYRAYLQRYPQGSFRAEAETQIERLRRDSRRSASVEQARQDEAQLSLLPVTLVLVEQRLRSLGFDPGKVDGDLTDQSRRAIRRYQETRNLEVTGYLSRQTLVRLIADQG